MVSEWVSGAFRTVLGHSEEVDKKSYSHFAFGALHI
jgi:hypothetical protein